MSAKPRLYAAPGTLISLAVILALGTAGVVALSSPSTARSRGSRTQRRAEPQCGDTITTDTTLHHDLVDCPNNGIVIGADDITLDLNGHRIDGDGTEFADCPKNAFCDVGVANGGHDGVTVAHGAVREFAVGVLAGKARNNRLLRISASRNEFSGIFLFSSRHVRILHNSIRRSGVGSGIAIFDSTHNLILHNSIRRSGHAGVQIANSTHNLIKGNRLSRNKGEEGAIELSSTGDPGSSRADRNVVIRNRASRNTSGIGIEGNRNIIRRNRINHSRGHGGGFGIPLSHGDHNLIARNSIRDTEGSAIGVGFERGAGNVVRRNRIRGAGELPGRGAAQRPQAGVLVDRRARRTLVVGNVIRGGAEDGIRVQAKARHTRLKGNHAFGAKDDGIDVKNPNVNNPRVKLTRNEARRNGDLGIEAVRGVIDGGGNVARHNGDPRQCKHIACG